jgi:hypothetical protein
MQYFDRRRGSVSRRGLIVATSLGDRQAQTRADTGTAGKNRVA